MAFWGAHPSTKDGKARNEYRLYSDYNIYMSVYLYCAKELIYLIYLYSYPKNSLSLSKWHCIFYLLKDAYTVRCWNTSVHTYTNPATAAHNRLLNPLYLISAALTDMLRSISIYRDVSGSL